MSGKAWCVRCRQPRRCNVCKRTCGLLQALTTLVLISDAGGGRLKTKHWRRCREHRRRCRINRRTRGRHQHRWRFGGQIHGVAEQWRRHYWRRHQRAVVAVVVVVGGARWRCIAGAGCPRWLQLDLVGRHTTRRCVALKVVAPPFVAVAVVAHVGVLPLVVGAGLHLNDCWGHGAARAHDVGRHVHTANKTSARARARVALALTNVVFCMFGGDTESCSRFDSIFLRAIWRRCSSCALVVGVSGSADARSTKTYDFFNAAQMIQQAQNNFRFFAQRIEMTPFHGATKWLNAQLSIHLWALQFL